MNEIEISQQEPWALLPRRAKGSTNRTQVTNTIMGGCKVQMSTDKRASTSTRDQIQTKNPPRFDMLDLDSI